MAGAMRKMAVYLGLVEDDARYYEDDDDDARRGDGSDERPERGSDGALRSASSREDRGTGSVSTLHATRGEVGTATDVTRITTIHPTTYNEAKSIGESFRTGTPVIMNLTEMVDSDAKRLVDFAAGLVFGLHGTIERVTAKVFLLSPVNVTVTAEDKARIAESGFFNQS